MKKAWFCLDPEAGLQRDEFAGTHVYEDTGKTLADDNDWYFQAPIHLAWLLGIVDATRSIVCRWIYKHYRGQNR